MAELYIEKPDTPVFTRFEVHPAGSFGPETRLGYTFMRTIGGLRFVFGNDGQHRMFHTHSTVNGGIGRTHSYTQADGTEGQLYLSGVDLNRDDFDSSGLGNVTFNVEHGEFLQPDGTLVAEAGPMHDNVYKKRFEIISDVSRLVVFSSSEVVSRSRYPTGQDPTSTLRVA